MRGGAYKSRARRSRLRVSRASQENRPDVTAIKTPELPQSHGDRSPVDRSLVQDATPSQTIKRLMCPASTNNCSPTKRARLTQTETQRQPSRRSARLQGQQHPGSAGSIRPLRALFRQQKTVATRPSKSEQSGLTRTDTQLEAEVGQTKAIKIKQQPNPLKQPSTTPPKGRIKEQEQASPTSDGNNNKQQLKRARLTLKNLAMFNKEETSKASVSAPPESTVAPSSTKTTTNTISTMASGFAIQAYENGILNPLISKPPDNLKVIRKRYTRSRETASPTESVYEDYVHTVGRATNEATMVVETSGALLKKYEKGYDRAFNQAFTGFPQGVGFNNGLSAPQPDFVEGLWMQEFCPLLLNQDVSGAVLYKDDPLSLTLPHLAGEWKGRGKDMEKARLKSAYDGAALVYARNKALSYLGKSDPPGHAQITTFTTDGTSLNLFAHYAAPTADGTLKYHQYPIKSTNLIDSHKGLKDGRRGLRNEQDYARKQSYAMRDQLKEHWKQRSGALQSVAQTAPLPVNNGTFSGTAADEVGYVVIEQPCHPTPAASSSVSSKSLLPVDDFVSRSSRPSHDSSRPRTNAQEYWEFDATSGSYYHRHSDGKVTWLEDSDDETWRPVFRVP